MATCLVLMGSPIFGGLLVIVCSVQFSLHNTWISNFNITSIDIFLFQDLVLRLDLFRKLEKHRGCVNTVSFNADGDILVSGSDDRRVILWDWETGHIKLSFHSGHNNNVFQAKMMPYSEDRSIVTCAADGQVISCSMRCIRPAWFEMSDVHLKLASV